MNPLLEATWELAQFLHRHQVDYAIIGGLAVQQWGIPRLTVDADLTVMLSTTIEDFVRLVTNQFPARVKEPRAFAKKYRILPIRSSNGQPIDISLGAPGYEEEVMRRAIVYKPERGKSIRICSAEDLIIHKAVAGRPKDVADLEGVISRQGRNLDTAYIRRWLRFFADAQEDPDAVGRFERAWRTRRRGAAPRSRGSTARKRRTTR